MTDKTYNKVRTEYRILRGRHTIGAKHALAWARAKYQDREDWEWSHDGETSTLEREGFTITLKVESDYYPDSSFLGEFGDTWQEGAITNDPDDSRLYRWFYPAITQAEHRAGLQALGMSKSVAEDLAREYVRRDMETAREYAAYVLIVSASREGIELGSDVLGGVDFSDDEDNQRQAEMIVSDHGMIDEALDQARATLAKLAGSVTA